MIVFCETVCATAKNYIRRDLKPNLQLEELIWTFGNFDFSQWDKLHKEKATNSFKDW